MANVSFTRGVKDGLGNITYYSKASGDLPEREYQVIWFHESNINTIYTDDDKDGSYDVKVASFMTLRECREWIAMHERIALPKEQDNVVVVDEERHVLAQCWQDYQDVIDAGVGRVILYGPPGTGKTYTGMNYKPSAGGVFRTICTEDMTTMDVAGGFMPAKEGFEYMAGGGLLSWMGDGFFGGTWVIDEIDRASGDVLSQLLAFTDSADSASFIHPITGVAHKPNQGFRVIMTTNLTDPDDLSPALRDRFPIAIQIDHAHEDALQLLPADIRSVARKIVGNKEGRGVSLRAFQEFDKVRAHMDQDRAAFLVFGDKAQQILDAVRVNGVGY
jgi:hypothetical protein